MIFQSFILDNLVSLWMKIMNSVVVVGLYYGFLTTFSIGPSYLFLLRARVMEEGTEKKASATTGFITGQLMMFISIYYAPLHLALGRPYTITVIALPYLLFHFFGKNHKNFLNYGYKNPNSIRNFSIPTIFFNNLIFQLLNPFFLPSSMLVRLVNIYMFRCNNKLLFLTSSFVGWLIGHTFLMKWIGLILVWIKQNNSIQSNVPIRSNKYIMSEFINFMSQLFIVFLFITCLCYLGRAPSAFFSNKLSEIQEKNEIDKKRKIDVEKTSETAGTKQEQITKKINKKNKKNKIYEEIRPPEKEKEKYIFRFQKTLVKIFFDYKRWNRPLRYIKNDQFENVIRNEISQFFFHTCQSDGKERISFTYPPNLSTFLKLMETKIYLLTTEKTSSDQLSNYWNFTNEEKTKKLSNEFINRAKVLDKEFIPLDIFEKRIRLCNDETKTKKYLPKIYDPFLNGPCRGRIKKCFSTSIKNETSKKNDIWINKTHGILFNINSNYSEFEQKIDALNIKSLLTEICFFLNLINKISGKSVSRVKFEALYLFREHKQVKMDFEEKKRKIKFLFDTIRTDLNDKTDKTITNRKKCIGIKEISKKVPRWSYKLIDELQQLEGKNQAESYGIRSRKAKRVVIFTNNSQNDDTYNDTRDADNTDKKTELALIRYSQQPDFRRDIIKGSIRAQRRKIVTWKLSQRNVHSPLFLDKIEKPSSFSLDIFQPMKIFFMFKNWMRKKTEFKVLGYTEKKTKESEKEEDKRKKNEKEEKRRIEIAEAWDSIIIAQGIRGFLLITQSILRKYIILPSLIITKNIVRILLFQFPEWSEDFRDWNREIYIKCTYNGVQLSESEFPKKWLTDGIQIKILFPFRLKPWHRSKLQYSEKEKDPMKKKKKKKTQDFCFLTIWGMEVELPFSGYPQNRLSFFFYPIFKELKKKMKNIKFFFFIVLKVLNERTKWFLNVSKDTVKWIIKSILKNILFLNEKIKKLPNFLFLFRLKKKHELSEKKDSTINTNNLITYESAIPIQSINWTNSSLTEKKIKKKNAKTKRIRNKIEKMKKEKKRRGFRTSEINISSNKTTFDAKRLELQKKICQILQRINTRLARKSYSFFKFLMERVYIVFICIVSIFRIILQLFLESTKKIINKIIYNTDKTNQSIIQLIKIIKKYYNIRNTNSQNDLSSLSQAYVFYKLSQTQVINVYKYKLRSVFEYYRRSFFFLKNEIKDYFFGVHGIFHSKLRHKNPPNSVMTQWANWLKGHSQYDLSQSTWSRLVPQKWRNRINERSVAENQDLTKWHSYEKNRLILYKKQQVNSLTKKKKMKKQYGYDLLSYKSINYVDKKDSYIYGYRSPFQANKKQSICYNYNMRKQKLFDITGDICITNYIAEGDIIDMKQNLDRKYFDWMGMNVEIQNRSISNLEFLLFSKFVIFYNAYTNNPWIVPIKLLFINFNVTKNVSENKKLTEKKKKIDIFRPSKKKSLELELETRNQTKAKAEYAGRVDLESSLSNQEKDIEEDSVGSDSTKDKAIKKKKYKNAELNLLLRKYFNFQFNWKGSLNQRIMNNIKVYCLLIRLINLKEIAIASIQRGELSLDIMVIQNLTRLGKNKNKELMKKGILIIQPTRLSRKNDNDEEFIMYQTTGFSLIHKSKHQINQRYPKKGRVNNKTFDKPITKTRDQKITENQEKNYYDLPVPENILSARRRRELRILICFNPRNINSVYRKTTFSNENKINNCCQVLAKNKDFDREKKKNLINFKFFLWPIYRLEDLACMNRYWFDSNNGSRFSIVRIHMYPRLKIR
uniref:Ycf1 n=1 Tax=Thermopsis alpina TaxID=114317 RepID=A0A6H0ENI0_9FABA|nr:Ycf1 [Thermopsis alpina]QIT02916.1 Ycf1 [Thermopsis alpina]